jgi:hypothetical protein
MLRNGPGRDRRNLSLGLVVVDRRGSCGRGSPVRWREEEKARKSKGSEETVMAKAKTNSVPVRRRGPDPTGRVDVLVIRLLEVAVEQHGSLPLRGIYGTYKKDIDQAIRHHVGKVKFHFPKPAQIGGTRA